MTWTMVQHALYTIVKGFFEPYPFTVRKRSNSSPTPKTKEHFAMHPTAGHEINSRTEIQVL